MSRNQTENFGWWQRHPMTYDWERTLALQPLTLDWFREIDRRFLESAYYARAEDGQPFGRFLAPSQVAGKRVLEIGCGMGTHAEILVRAGARLTAIDLTHRATQATRARLDLCGLRASINRADAETLPFGDGAFDFVWTWGVIHHSSNPERCLGEIARVLKPGGRLLLMVYHRRSLAYYLHCGLIRGVLLGRLRKETLREIYEASTDGRYAAAYSKPELRNLLAEGFSSVRATIVGLKAELLPVPRSALKRRLERSTPDRLARALLGRWGSMVVVEAQRRTPAR